MRQPMPKNTSKLTIGFVLDDGLDSTDGVQQYVLTLGTWLASKGHKVHYIVGETKRGDIKNLHSMSRNLRVKFNGNVLSTPLPAKNSEIKHLFKKINFDVLHVQVPYSPFMAAKVVKYAPAHTTIVGTYHILPFGWLQSYATRMLGLALRRSLRRFDSFIAVSGAAKEFAKKTFNVDAEIIPNTVDIKKFKTVNSKDKNLVTLAYLGRLVERKGCRELIDAVHVIRKNKLVKTKFKLNIYGKGPDGEQLKRQAANYGLGDIVEFHGFISEDAKPHVLGNADVAVFPATGAESFGIVLIEAMASGAGAVLGGDNPGYRSVLGETPEAIFNPKNTELFACQLAAMIEDDELRASVHLRQQKMVRQYDINTVGALILEQYCKKHSNT